MAIRVRVRLTTKRSNRSSESTALVNSGYEADEPEVVIPEKLAERLRFLPELPPGTRLEEYESVLGKARFHYLPKALKVAVLTADRKEGPITCDVAIAPGEHEVLLSDKLIDALNLVPERPGVGFWRFRDEPPTKTRKSVVPEKW